MALIFQRLARNFIKNGYFPTDEETIARIVNMIDAPAKASIQLFDPCCGEGIALAECGHALQERGCEVTTAAIEFNQERAQHAKSLLHHVVHADIQDCVMGQQQFGMLWLNPPYGDRLTDQSDQTSSGKGRDRLEKYFLAATLPSLQYGGLLVYIVPHYVLDKHLARQLAISLDKASVYRLTEERFRQVVVMGYRRRQVPVGEPEKAFIDQLLAIREDRQLADELPASPKTLNKIVKREGTLQRETLSTQGYSLPATRQEVLNKGLQLRTIRLTADAVSEVWSQHKGLWPEFDTHFQQHHVIRRRPARALSSWHLALMLAAGQVSGRVRSVDGRELLVKGGTHKQKEAITEYRETEDGIEETRILVDRFIPVIRAIDVSCDRSTFGDVLTIR